MPSDSKTPNFDIINNHLNCEKKKKKFWARIRSPDRFNDLREVFRKISGRRRREKKIFIWSDAMGKRGKKNADDVESRPAELLTAASAHICWA